MPEYFVKIQGPRPDEYNGNGDCFTKDALKKAIGILNGKKNTKAYFAQEGNLMIETVVNIAPEKLSGQDETISISLK